MEEDTRTRGCLHFTLWGIHTTIYPSSWLALLVLGSSLYTPGNSIRPLLVFITFGMLCLLMHEYGHALMHRLLTGGSASIRIAALGGKAHLDSAPCSRKQILLIALAGPGASILLGLLGGLALGIWIGNPLAGLSISCLLPFFSIPGVTDWLLPHLYPLLKAYQIGSITPETVSYFEILFSVTMWWSAFNLLPMMPTDGARVLLCLTRNVRVTTLVGMVIAGGLILLSLLRSEIFLALICGFLLHYNYRIFKQTL